MEPQKSFRTILPSQREAKLRSIPIRHLLNNPDVAPLRKAPKKSRKTQASTLPSPGLDAGPQLLFVESNSFTLLALQRSEDRRLVKSHVQRESHRQRRLAATERLNQNGGVQVNVACTGENSQPSVYVNHFEEYHSEKVEELTSRKRRRSNPPRHQSPPHKVPWPNQPQSPPRKRPPVLEDGPPRIEICHHCGVHTASRYVRGAQSDNELETEAIRVAINFRSRVRSRLRASKSSPGTFLDTLEVDPFSTSLTPMTRSMNSIFHHYLDVITPTIFPIAGHAAAYKEWVVQLSFSQPRVLYAVLACGCAELLARSGQLVKGSPETTYKNTEVVAWTQGDAFPKLLPNFVDYKLKAVKVINEKMSNSTEAQDIATIYGVMSLLAIEIITGDTNEIAAHVTGLQRLIFLRGGYHGFPPTVLEVTLGACYMCAAMTRSIPPPPPPALSTSDVASTSANIAFGANPLLEEMGLGLLDPEIAPPISRKLIQATRELRDVTLYREFFHSNDDLLPPSVMADHYDWKSYSFRYLALTIPFDPPFPPPHSPIQPPSDLAKQESIRIAILIFWNANYLIGDPTSALWRSLTSQLKSALEFAPNDLRNLWRPQHSELLFWILFLGAHICTGQRERPWFVLKLAQASRVLGLKDEEDAKSLMRRFFYIERIYEASVRRIWEELRMVVDVLPSEW